MLPTSTNEQMSGRSAYAASWQSHAPGHTPQLRADVALSTSMGALTLRQSPDHITSRGMRADPTMGLPSHRSYPDHYATDVNDEAARYLLTERYSEMSAEEVQDIINKASCNGYDWRAASSIDWYAEDLIVKATRNRKQYRTLESETPPHTPNASAKALRAECVRLFRTAIECYPSSHLRFMALGGLTHPLRNPDFAEQAIVLCNTGGCNGFAHQIDFHLDLIHIYIRLGSDLVTTYRWLGKDAPRLAEADLYFKAHLHATHALEKNKGIWDLNGNRQRLLTRLEHDSRRSLASAQEKMRKEASTPQPLPPSMTPYFPGTLAQRGFPTSIGGAGPHQPRYNEIFLSSGIAQDPTPHPFRTTTEQRENNDLRGKLAWMYPASTIRESSRPKQAQYQDHEFATDEFSPILAPETSSPIAAKVVGDASQAYPGIPPHELDPSAAEFIPQSDRSEQRTNSEVLEMLRACKKITFTIRLAKQCSSILHGTCAA
jgi:hypothetical protein